MIVGMPGVYPPVQPQFCTTFAAFRSPSGQSCAISRPYFLIVHTMGPALCYNGRKE